MPIPPNLYSLIDSERMNSRNCTKTAYNLTDQEEELNAT